MAKTFMQMADEEMAKAHAISAEEAVKQLKQDPNALLVDVRDESEVEVTGMGIGAVNAPGRSLAWKADLEIDEEYIAHAAMKLALGEIVDRHEMEPWGFSGEEAATIASETLEYVERVESDVA